MPTPWGKEFGQINTIWLLNVGDLRIVHLGDNGPLTDDTIRAMGRVPSRNPGNYVICEGIFFASPCE